MPTMFRALISIGEDKLEYNNKILKTGIVPPTERITGTGEDYPKVDNPPIYGSAWSLNHDYVLNNVGNEPELHAILKKRIIIKYVNRELEIAGIGCYILNEELEGVYIVCIEPVKFDSADVYENVNGEVKWIKRIEGAGNRYPYGKR